jgi:hypothetical protein
MSLRDVGSYIGHNRVTTTSQDSASGIWSLAAVERRMRAAAWPLVAPGDEYFANVSLLLHMDGSGNTFTDSSASPKTLTAAGNVTQSTAQSKWGGKSALFDGNGDYISVANTSGLDFGTGDFVAEFWIYFTSSVSTSQQILYSETEGGWFIGLFNAGEIGIGRTGVAWDHYAAHSMTTNSWNHIAVARSGTSLRIYVNGSQVGSTYTNSQSYTLAGGALRIGGPGGSEYNITGYIDDVRITKGTARGYTGASITPPTAPFPS